MAREAARVQGRERRPVRVLGDEELRAVTGAGSGRAGPLRDSSPPVERASDVRCHIHPN